MTVFGIVLLLSLAIISRRVPDPPPWVVKPLVGLGDLTAVAGSAYHLAFDVLMVVVGTSALLGGLILIARAFSLASSFTFSPTYKDRVTFDNPRKLVFVPIGVVLGLASVVVWSSPATLARPGSIVQWGYVKFSNDLTALFLLTFLFGWGTFILVDAKLFSD